MGFLDWFKGSSSKKGRKRRDSHEEPLPRGKRTSDDSDRDRELERELEKERLRVREQEKRIKEMEGRFQQMQENWVQLLDKQQAALEKFAKERTGRKVGASKQKAEVNAGSGDGLISSPILPEKTFSNFVVDEANRFPYLAAEAVATGIGRKYNPLFIFGPVGVGKTHLLHAIANKMLETDPGKSLLYSSTERFTDELLKALERDDLDKFRSRYREVDMLLVDDIQMLSGREATQKEFFHMFNHLYNSGKQIVLCSDRPPSEIKELESRLRSRFEGGLIIDIKVPTFEGRRQIIVNLAQQAGMSLPTEVLDYLAFYLDSNVRELEGGFNRVTAYSSFMKEPITISLIRRVLEGVLLKKDIPFGPLEKEGREVPPPELEYTEMDPYSSLELEEETDQLEKELLMELKRSSSNPE
ncbi:MAG: chromosomal replication initiator protein DnaA [Thermoplasmatota archaeon]